MGKTNSPCFGCKERTVECHPGCERYLEYKAEIERNRNIIKNSRTYVPRSFYTAAERRRFNIGQR